MKLPTPFIYISALMRTGSTMLSEALTQLPHSIIFLEPYWGLNSFSLHAPGLKQLRARGVDLERFVKLRRPMAFLLRRLRPLGVMQDFMIREVKRTLVPQLLAIGVQQIGVKEIRHVGWQHYVRHFAGMKMIMLGRDPRDIYLSTYRKLQLGGMTWHEPVTPETVARHLNAHFSLQLEMSQQVDCLTIRYEELCTDPFQLPRILSFCQSPLESAGTVGSFLSSHPIRKGEYQRHGDTISDRSVFRWQREENKKLLDEAFECAALMPEYIAFWDYDE